jgi:hypothetical protein
MIARIRGLYRVVLIRVAMFIRLEAHRVTRAVLILGLLLCVSASLQAQTHETGASRPFTLLAGSYGALAGWDAQMTAACLSQGRCRETNPLLQPLASRPTLLAATKLGTSSAFLWTAFRLRHEHPKVAWGLLIGAVTLQAVVDGRNVQTLRKGPGPR